MSGRLGYLLKKFPRLSETFVLGEILAQERLGRDITIFARRPCDDEPRHPELEELRAVVEVLPHSRHIDPWQVLFDGTETEDGLLSRLGEVIRRGREWGHERFPSLLTEALHLHKRTRELGVSHLHVHFATDSAIVAMLLERLGGPTFSMTVHAKDIYRTALSIELQRELYGEAEFVVTVCDANVEYLREHLGRAATKGVRRLYNGIDLASFEGSDATERDDDHVLAVGRLVEKKGFRDLIEAARRLVPTRPSLRVTIIGDGEERRALQDQIEGAGLEKTVTLLGPRDQDDVRAWMRRATVFCLPCVIGEDGNRDALPTVLLEAQAAGIPAISTPVVGIAEILDQGRAGALVPCRDPAALTAALDRLLGDGSERRRIVERGRAHAAENFDRERSAGALFAWFEAALQQGSAACV